MRESSPTRLNSDPKYVVSTTARPNPEWQNTTVISERRRLGRSPDAEGRRPTARSSSPEAARWWRTLLENDLVDELRLMVFPTILGRGKRLFPDGIDRLKLRPRRGEDGRPGRPPGPGLRAGRLRRPTGVRQDIVGSWRYWRTNVMARLRRRPRRHPLDGPERRHAGGHPRDGVSRRYGSRSSSSGRAARPAPART